MTTFHFVAKDAEGRLVRDTVQAEVRWQALQALRERGLVVVDLTGGEEAEAKAQAPAAARPAVLRHRRVGRLDIAVFCRQLAIAVNAGLPIRDALESISEDVENVRLRSVLGAVVKDLHDGCQLSEALARHKDVFSELFVALVLSAEESGSMARTLDHLANYLERGERLARRIRSITAYPLFILVFFVVVCAIMTVYILPQFEAVFAENKGQLPALTRVVLGTNRFLLGHAVAVLGGAGALVAGLVLLARSRWGRLKLDRLKLHLPFFGICLRKYGVARMCRTLGIMLEGGVPLTTGLTISASVMGNRVLEAMMLRTRDQLLRGRDLAGSLAGERDMPRLVVRMVGVGESSGRLPLVLEKVADGYEDQVEGAILVATSLFEPVIICVLGGFVLTLVLAIYLPIFTISRTVQ